MADILERKQLYRDHYKFSTRLLAGARQHMDKVLWGGALAWCVAPLFPLSTIAAGAFFLAGASDANSNSPRGPFMKPKPGKRAKTAEWTRFEGPKDKGGKGAWFIGNAMDTGEELWTTDDIMRRHMLIFGTTGSGKTVTLEGYIYQAIAHGSGVIFVDGKADPKTWFDVYSMAKMCNRENDVRVLNFITGSGMEKLVGFSDEEIELCGQIHSNTFNPFSQGNSDTLTELVVSLMRPEGSGDGGMWRGRAEAMVRALMRALCELRDRGLINLSVDSLRSYMTLEKIGVLDQNPDLPEAAKMQIKAYLDELPGYRPGMECDEGSQERMQFMEQAEKQHGFLTMQFTELLGLLSGTYKHIFDVEQGEIDFQDVVYNRRILLVMLPALEKSPSSLANLGRICVAGIKNALSVSLKGQLTGSKREIVDSRPTNSDTALLAIMDEYGSYAVEGFGDVVAQARSLGVSAIFAGQDYPSFTKGSEIEAKRIWANTGIKMFLKTEDSETADLAIKRSGEAHYLMLGGKREIQPGNIVDNQDTGWQKDTRLTYRDLVDQSEGWGFIMYNDYCIQFNAFYVPINVAQQAKHNTLFPLGRELHKKYIKRYRDMAASNGRQNTGVAMPSADVTQAEAGDPTTFSLFSDPSALAAMEATRPGEVPTFPGMEDAEAAGIGAPLTRRDARLLDDLADLGEESACLVQTNRVASLFSDIRAASTTVVATADDPFGIGVAEGVAPAAIPMEVSENDSQEDTDSLFAALTNKVIGSASSYLNLDDAEEDDSAEGETISPTQAKSNLDTLEAFFADEDDEAWPAPAKASISEGEVKEDGVEVGQRHHLSDEGKKDSAGSSGGAGTSSDSLLGATFAGNDGMLVLDD